MQKNSSMNSMIGIKIIIMININLFTPGFTLFDAGMAQGSLFVTLDQKPQLLLLLHCDGY